MGNIAVLEHAVNKSALIRLGARRQFDGGALIKLVNKSCLNDLGTVDRCRCRCGRRHCHGAACALTF